MSLLGKSHQLYKLIHACIFVSLFLVLPYSWWEELKYILLSVYFLCSSLYFYYNKIYFNLSSIDISLVLLCLLSLLSTFWAIDKSLALTDSFTLLLFTLWAILFRAGTEISYQNISLILHRSLVVIFLVYLLIGILILVFNTAPYAGNWNKAIGMNMNYHSAFLLCLSPFLFSYKINHSFGYLVKSICFLGLIVFLFYSKSLSSLIALIFLSILVPKLPSVPILDKKIGITFITIGIIVLSLSFFLQEDNIGYIESTSRYQHGISSLKIFLNHPIFGVGSGNWLIYINSFDLSDILPYRFPYKFNYQWNHNYYLKLLSELGIIGIVLYLYPLIKVLIRGMKNLNTSSFCKSLLCSFLMITIVFSNLYATSYSRQFDFNETQLLLFTYIGLGYSHKSKPLLKCKPINITLSIVILSLLSTAYFVDSAYRNNLYFESVKKASKDNFSEAQAILDNVHHPLLKTSIGFTPITLSQSIYALAMNDTLRSIDYINLGLKFNPYHSDLLRKKSILLLEFNNDLESSKRIALDVYSRNYSNYDNNLLLSEILMIQNKLDSAKIFLDKVQLSPAYPNYLNHKKKLADNLVKYHDLKNQ